ncbi:MAG TPA: hypothetical protein VN154_06570 [Rhizomicrobium sp.]|nr:hypothetical protein [Rhizomicrobium sp.]
MTFHYDTTRRKVVDDETGVEIYPGSRPDIAEWPFIFFDAQSDARQMSWSKRGEFSFVVSPIFSPKETTGSSGSATKRIEADYKINKKHLQATFAPYVEGDAKKFLKICDLITRGLREWSVRGDVTRQVSVAIE